MKTYRMEWQAWTAGIPWKHEFTMASDRMALDYAQRTVIRSAVQGSDLGMALLLWDLDNQILLARFELEEPTARNTVKESVQ